MALTCKHGVLGWCVLCAWPFQDRRQAGVGTVELFVAVVALGMVLGALHLYGSHQYERGRLAERDEARQLADARQRGVDQALKRSQQERDAARAEAQGNQQKLKEALRVVQRTGKPLGSCNPARPHPRTSVADQVQPAEAAGGNAAAGLRADGVGDPGDRGPRLHWRYVGLHDSAFLGADGKPLFEDSARYAGDPARADTHSPYGLDDALAVSADNASALSTCWVEYFGARRELEVAAEAWDKEKR